MVVSVSSLVILFHCQWQNKFAFKLTFWCVLQLQRHDRQRPAEHLNSQLNREILHRIQRFPFQSLVARNHCPSSSGSVAGAHWTFHRHLQPPPRPSAVDRLESPVPGRTDSGGRLAGSANLVLQTSRSLHRPTCIREPVDNRTDWKRISETQQRLVRLRFSRAHSSRVWIFGQQQPPCVRGAGVPAPLALAFAYLRRVACDTSRLRNDGHRRCRKNCRGGWSFARVCRGTNRERPVEDATRWELPAACRCVDDGERWRPVAVHARR